MSLRPLIMTLALSLAAPALAEDRPALPMGAEAGAGVAREEEPAIFAFEASAAGVLLVTATSASPDADLAIRVTDDEGQTLPSGTADIDFLSFRAKEAGAIPLTGPGRYLVQIVVLTAGGAEQVQFEVLGAFLANPNFARPADPDGRPSQAATITPGAEALEATLGPDDLWDWYVIHPDASGHLTLRTRAPEGDFLIEVYTGGKFDEPVDRADDDDDGVLGNETLELEATKGQAVYLRVTLLPDPERQGDLGYRVSASIAN